MPPLRVTCALIERERKILVAQRPPGKALEGKWEFPGGKIDVGESSEDCLLREIREELGCEISIIASLSPVVHAYQNGSIELIPFHCAVQSGEPSAIEHSSIEWIDPVSLLEIDLADADRPIALEFLSLYTNS